MGYRKIVVEMDSKIVVDWMQENILIRFTPLFWYYNGMQRASYWQRMDNNHVYRECNKGVANYLANLSSTL